MHYRSIILTATNPIRFVLSYHRTRSSRRREKKELVPEFPRHIVLDLLRAAGVYRMDVARVPPRSKAICRLML
jgi:hypothetical protein